MHQPTPADKPVFDTLPPPPGDISDLAHLLRSPLPVPSSPSPAYTALPHRDVDFHLAPLIHGRIGDIELETTDGKRFLVHRKILEQETVFFHIYYGFVPVWRLAAPHLGPPHPALPSGPPPPHPAAQAQAAAAGAIGNLLCLPKFIASHLRPLAQPATASSHYRDLQETERLLSPTTSDDHAPAPPPKDITAPTPTASPFTWRVPESSSTLASFLVLIYPRGAFGASHFDALPTLEVTSRVIRASMGYQSTKALNIARDRLAAFIDDQPMQVYATACFFKFTDLARLASEKAVAVSPEDWSGEVKNLMGRSGAKHLVHLREVRMAGLRGILIGSLETDGHSGQCVRGGMIEQLWKSRVEAVKRDLKPESELLELLEVDLRGGHCGDCLVLLGQTIQRSILEARHLPTTI